MTSAWAPPRATHHLRVFAISLLFVVLCLAGLLFGVEMEAIVPVTGIVTARELQEVRAVLPGLVEPGWYDGEIIRPDGTLAARLDSQGTGRVDPAVGDTALITRFEWTPDERTIPVKRVRFHRLQPGDELWPGQVIAAVRVDHLRSQVERIEDELKERESRGDNGAALLRERDRLRSQIGQSFLRVPEGADHWQVLEVRAAQLQAVAPGDVVAVIVPLDPQTRQLRDLVARLDVDEKHWGMLAPEQTVRVKSNVHHHRMRGCAEARIDRLEPCGEATADGPRRFRATARITAAPFVLPIGSGFQAEVIVGKKRVYRIILEH